MDKQNLNFNDLKDLVFSPGNIFWQQKSGAMVLLASKGEFLNIKLIEKCFNAKCILLIENQINSKIQNDFIENFKGHQSEILIKNKLPWRLKILSMCREDLGVETLSQFDLNLLSWQIFSNIDLEVARGLIDTDVELFKRSMSISSGYTLCAFLLGHYDDKFLSNLFSETFLSLMNFQKPDNLKVMKGRLENIRTLDHLEVEERDFLEKTYQLSQKKNVLIGERFDGSGVKGFHQSEMTDLELVFIAVCKHYSYSSNLNPSILYEIKSSLFTCAPNILNLLKKSLMEKNSNSHLEMSA